jgi:hypothetical protein
MTTIIEYLILGASAVLTTIIVIVGLVGLSSQPEENQEGIVFNKYGSILREIATIDTNNCTLTIDSNESFSSTEVLQIVTAIRKCDSLICEESK